MKKLRAVLAVFAFYLLSILPASAHVKWFVEEEVIAPTPWYQLSDMPVLIWSVVLVFMLGLGIYLDKKTHAPKKFLLFVEKYERQIHYIAKLLLGVFLLVTVNFFWDSIITPYVPYGNQVRTLISGLQMALGIMFVFNLWPRFSSLVLMLLCLALGYSSGMVVFAENLLLFSLAVYLFLDTFKTGSLPKWIENHKLDILRIGSGVCLIVLAFTEKLLFPEFSLAFLDTYQWNFMQPIFPNFSNNLFVLSVGMSELLFGVLFTFGYLTRITTLALAVFLITSAITMFISIGDWEPGHVVIYAVALLFVFFGRGESIKKD